MSNRKISAKRAAETPLLAAQNGDSDSLQETDIDSPTIPTPNITNVNGTQHATSRDLSNSPAFPHNHDNDGTRAYFIYRLAFFSAIGGFLFGYDTGVVSGAMIIIPDIYRLNSLWQELVVSITIGAAALFCPVGGTLNDRWGRRPTILLASVIFAFGAILLGAAMNRGMLLAGRLILGIGIGLSSTTVPMYIAESAPSNMRGKLVTFYNLSITTGQFTAGIADGAFSYLKPSISWRFMLGLASVPAVIQFVGFIFMPETPRYLLTKNKDDEARNVLKKIWGHSEVEDELMAIKQSIEIDHVQEDSKSNAGCKTIWRMLTTPSVRKALIVGCGLQLFQQICGINTVMYYSATIIKMSGVQDPSMAIWLAALTATANFIFSFVGLYLVDRIGRRALTLGSLAGVCLSLMVLAIGFQVAANNSPAVTTVEMATNQTAKDVGKLCAAYSTCDPCTKNPQCGYCYIDEDSRPQNGSCVPAVQDSHGTPLFNASMYGRCSQVKPHDATVWMYAYCPTNIAWLITLGLILYLASFAPGMGPMPWTINSEIYPTWARSTGNAIATTTNWTFNLLISITFLTLTETLTTYGAFWLYSGFALLGIVFLSLLLPETKGKSLEEMEILFQKPICSYN